MKCPNCGYTQWYSPDHRGPCNCSPEAIKAAARKAESERVYSDDFKPCQCGSETFARYEVFAYPPVFDGAKAQLSDSIRCARCQRVAIRVEVTP